MNVRLTLICIAATALLSSGCSNLLEERGSDGPYSTLSLALSLKSPGDVPGGQTKMTTAITQDGTSFRGIEQVYMIPFLTASASPVENGSARLGDRNVVIENSAIGENGLVAKNNSHLYNMVMLPWLMNRVLAYGKAFDSGSVSTREGKHRNGVLTPIGLDDPVSSGDISFSLESILEKADETAVGETTDNLIAALNGVVEALQGSGDADILAFLDDFATENEISACSYQTLYRLEQNILDPLSLYNGANAEAISSVMSSISALQAARNAAGSGFPSAYGIPEGAVGMWWNGHRFVKLLNGVNISLIPAPLYCYPPSLWYYANSSIKTSADDGVKEQYKPQNSTWDKILDYYSDGTSVSSSTRSVAIVDQMQYGVGLVEFHFLPYANASAAAGCPLIGIIIGEQREVDYSFTPISSDPSQFQFVYDNNVSGITLGTTDKCVQVLVLPTANDEVVHFALEFKNNTSSSFTCQQGTIYPGCTFYLAGELKPEDGSNPTQAPISSVFSSDYKTTVKVKVLNLGKAYNTVPDLRDPQLELGVMAQMDWIQVEPGGVKLPF
ncbi:MAG: hypothetical protein J6W82_04895 [Bacteroidales bacterium]|nr:hypothetical protein [Bacteroidales bacterium]